MTLAIKISQCPLNWATLCQTWWWLTPKALGPPSAKITNARELVKRTGWESSPCLLPQNFQAALDSLIARGYSIFMPLPLSLSSWSSSWCSELYLAPLGTDGARQPAKPWRPKPERSGAAHSVRRQAASKTATQTIKPANQRRQPGHAPMQCHGHTHETTHTKGHKSKTL